MSGLSGTYMVIDGHVQKVSDAIPSLGRSVYFNKGGVPKYDPSARETFQSKAHKRQWLKVNGLREGGIIQKDGRWEGPAANRSKPTAERLAARAQRQAWIQSQGGTTGLLDRLQQGGSNVL